MQSYKKSLFIFHRDLRLEDNRALIAATEQSEQVIPCFIFDPAQVSDQNAYKSNNALQFLIESLKDLHETLLKEKNGLAIFYGKTDEIIQELLVQEQTAGNPIEAIFSSRDYTPFSHKRDTALEKICKKHDCSFVLCPNILLNEPKAVLKDDGTPYTIFTPFYKKALSKVIERPIAFTKNMKKKLSLFNNKKSISQEYQEQLYKKVLQDYHNTNVISGGRSAGLIALKKAQKINPSYLDYRDFPEKDSITHLSAHHKFGTVSIRESFWAFKESEKKPDSLTRQLYWRDFFTHIAFHAPHVFGHAFREKYEEINWSRSTNSEKFHAWQEGVTGFPIVDAGMRELATTGFMHNRVRMIVAFFLTKDLHIHWLLGERYFAQQLVDYDPAVNNGNWQWAASTGCDAQPYFRIFNPWLQQKKFDPEALYIKKWIPELQHLSAEDIHNWDKKYQEKKALSTKYRAPLIDHREESKKSIIYFKQKK